ncbi:hypothetical protein [Novosphingobium nitrogenifigens]|uniref:hypothetical protein n=1 Tax=Novosphingobium nitrogenifigens TaxID=378548 RepID=UPI00036330EB|nr:hypothetical protein [Novosphingobium nitrogenifigens]
MNREPLARQRDQRQQHECDQRAHPARRLAAGSRHKIVGAGWDEEIRGKEIRHRFHPRTVPFLNPICREHKEGIKFLVAVMKEA